MKQKVLSEPCRDPGPGQTGHYTHYDNLECQSYEEDCKRQGFKVAKLLRTWLGFRISTTGAVYYAYTIFYAEPGAQAQNREWMKRVEKFENKFMDRVIGFRIEIDDKGGNLSVKGLLEQIGKGTEEFAAKLIALRPKSTE